MVEIVQIPVGNDPQPPDQIPVEVYELVERPEEALVFHQPGQNVHAADLQIHESCQVILERNNLLYAFLKAFCVIYGLFSAASSLYSNHLALKVGNCVDGT